MRNDQNVAPQLGRGRLGKVLLHVEHGVEEEVSVRSRRAPPAMTARRFGQIACEEGEEDWMGLAPNV